MKILLLISLSFLFIHGNFAQENPPKHPEVIKWKKFNTEEELKTFIFKTLSTKPTKGEVLTYFEHQKGYAGVHENIIYVTSKSWFVSLMISKCWLLEFHFDNEGNFTKFSAKTALTGS